MTALRLALVLFCLLVVLTLGIVALPFTEAGTRVLVALLPVSGGLELEHEGGSLLGNLSLRRVRVTTEDVVVELEGVHSALDPVCLWRREICLRSLSIAVLGIEILPSDEETTGDEEPGSFWPLRFSVGSDDVSIEQLRLFWGAGEIRSNRITGTAAVAGSRISIDRLAAHGTRLLVPDTGEPSTKEPLQLPDVDLPLELVVAAATLHDSRWDIYGLRNDYDELSLTAHWAGTRLTITESRVDNRQWGGLSLEGSITFVHPYTFNTDARFEATTPPPWRGLHGAAGDLQLRGNLADLALEGQVCRGHVPLALRGNIDLVNRARPLNFAARGGCGGSSAALVLNELPGLQEGPALSVAGDWDLHLEGDFSVQELVLETTLIAPKLGLPVRVKAQGVHEAGRLEIGELLATRQDQEQSLQMAGELSYGSRLAWDLSLDMKTVELPPLGPLAGQLSGTLQFGGLVTDDAWSIELTDAAIRGTVNELPADLSGGLKLNHQLDFDGSDLEVDVNGARLRMVARAGQTPRAELDVEDIGRWLEDAAGRFQAAVSWDREKSSLTLHGNSGGLHWGDLRLGQLQLDGWHDYRAEQEFNLAVRGANVRLGDAVINALTIEVQGTPQQHRLQLEVDGDLSTTLVVDGGLVAGDWSGRLQPMTLASTVGDWQLSETVAVDYLEDVDQLSFSGHCWHDVGLALCIDELNVGTSGGARLELEGDLRSFSGLLPEGFAIHGPLAAWLDTRWTDFDVQRLAAGLEIKSGALEEQLLSSEWTELLWRHMSLEYNGDSAQGRLRGSVQQGDSESLSLDLTMPAALDGDLAGELVVHSLELNSFQNLLEQLSQLHGQVTGSLQFSGQAREPEIFGSLSLRNGLVTLAQSPTSLEEIEFQAQFKGRSADLRGQLSVGGGSSQLQGKLDWLEQLRLSLAMTGGEKRLVSPPSMNATVSENLLLELSTEQISLTGSVDVLRGELVLEELAESAVEVSDDVVLFDHQGTPLQQGSPTPVMLAIQVNIDDSFLVRTEGVEGRLGGQIKLERLPRQPLLVLGSIDVLEGKFELLGPRFDVKRGNLSFVGVPDNPELDIVLEREISEDQVTVGIRVGGNLALPELDFYSRPALPEAEVMAYVLGGRGIDRTGNNSSLGLALAMTSSLMQAGGILQGVSLGVEGKDNNARAAIGGYISDRIYVSYGVGLYVPVSTLTVRMDILRNLWAEMVSGLQSSGDLYYAWSI